MGPSGTGKSVLLKHIIGLLKPDRGEVWIDGEEITTMRDRDLMRVRRKLGVLFQDGALFGVRQMRGSMGLGGSPGRRSNEMTSTAKAQFDSLQAALKEHHEATADTIARLRTFGQKAGLAFQIVDDVLDMTQSSEELGKTAGKDTASIKATWPAVFGIDKSLKDAEELIADAFAALEPFGETANPLKSLASYLVERKN
jgi:geranylgeranyl diphosphate synthase type II